MKEKRYDRRSVEAALKATGEWFRDAQNPNLKRTLEGKHRGTAYTPTDSLFAFQVRSREMVKVNDRIRPLFESSLVGKFVLSRSLVIPKEMPNPDQPLSNVAWLEPLVPRHRPHEDLLKDQKANPPHLVGVNLNGLARLMCIEMSEATLDIEKDMAFDPMLLQTRA